MEKQFYAKIKYVEDNIRRAVPLSDILQFQTKISSTLSSDEEPEFDKQAIYTIMWTDNNGEELELPIQIADIKMIRNEEDLSMFEEKRGIFTKLHDSVINEFYDNEGNFEEVDNEKKPSNLKLQRKVHSESEKQMNIRKLTHEKDAQKEILKKRMDNLLSSKSLTVDDEYSDVIPVNVSSSKNIISSNANTASDDTKRRLTNKVKSLEQQCERSTLELKKMHNEVDVLKSRLETYRSINEKLQFENYNYIEKIKLLENRSSTPIESLLKYDDDTVMNMTPKSTTKRRYDLEESPSLLQKRHPAKKLNFQKPPKIIDNKDSEETQDFFNSENLNSDMAGPSDLLKQSPVKLSNSECKTLTFGLFRKKPLRDVTNDVCLTETKRQESANDDDSCDSKTEFDTPAELSGFFKKFGQKESFINEDNIKTNFIWLNHNFKVLYDDWKKWLKVKTESKFVKLVLREMHKTEEGSYFEKLSKRCVSDAVVYTPNKRNRRIPLDKFEHATLERCLKYFCIKVLKKNEDQTRKAILKKNAYITEDINSSIKKIKIG